MIKKKNQYTRIRIKSPDDFVKRRRLDVNSPENSNEVLNLDKSNLAFDIDRNVFSNPSFSNMDISYENDIKSFSSNIKIPAVKKSNNYFKFYLNKNIKCKVLFLK